MNSSTKATSARGTERVYQRRWMHGGVAGTVIGVDRDGRLVACADGVVAMRELQLPGRKKMTTEAFVAGHPIATGTRLNQ